MQPRLLYAAVRDEHARRHRQAHLEHAARARYRIPDVAPARRTAALASLPARLWAAARRLAGTAARGRARAA